MVMAVSGHWDLRLVSNVYQVCLLFYIRILSYLGNLLSGVGWVMHQRIRFVLGETLVVRDEKPAR